MFERRFSASLRHAQRTRVAYNSRARDIRTVHKCHITQRADTCVRVVSAMSAPPWNAPPARYDGAPPPPPPPPPPPSSACAASRAAPSKCCATTTSDHPRAVRHVLALLVSPPFRLPHCFFSAVPPIATRPVLSFLSSFIPPLVQLILKTLLLCTSPRYPQLFTPPVHLFPPPSPQIAMLALQV